MTKYVVKRVLMGLATLFVILFVLFLMLRFMPGTPFNDEKLTEAQRLLLYNKYGLDKPFLVQFWNYFTSMLRGDFGLSYVINKNFAVSGMVMERLTVSIRIGLQAMVVGSVIGILLGIWSALKRNTWVDTLCSGISVLGVSVPSYVFALLLAYFIGYKLKLLPILWSTKNVFASTILPTIALGLFPVANIARFTRSELIDVMGSDYVLLASSKGIHTGKLIFRHELRNAMIPIITVMGPLLVDLLTGSMVVEKIFGIPGIGSLMVQAIQYNDYNVVLATAFVYSALYIFTMMIVDILYGVIDPRIRVAKEG